MPDEYKSNDIRNTKFKDINDEYAWAKLSDFKVIMMMSNGYINATDFCKKVGKEFKNWKANAYSKELILEVASSVGLSTLPEKLMIRNMTSSMDKMYLRGTYVHPKLMINIAMWSSAKYGSLVSDIVIDFHAREAIEEKDRLLQKKEDKIDRLSRKVDKQSEEIHELLSENKKQSEEVHELLSENKKHTEKLDKMNGKNKKLKKVIKHLVDKVEDIHEQNEDIIEKIEDICDDRVIKCEKPDDTHMFIILKNNCEDPEDDDYEYHVIRRLRKTVPNAIAEHIDVYPDATILVKITYNPNPINLWKRIKAGLNRKIKRTGNNFKLKGKFTEEMLLEKVHEINEERYNYE